MFFTFLAILGTKGGECVERFACRARIISGPGAIRALAEEHCSRLLMVMHAADAARGEKIRQMSGAAEAECFNDLDREPTVKQAVTGSQMIRQWEPDLVAALGDRAVMDCAKAMVCFSGHPCTLAAIPIGVGCGSEITGSVTLFHNGSRHLLCGDAMKADLVILDPELAAEVKGESWAEAGFEILSAALEAYTAPVSGMLRDIHAREGFAACWAALPAACAGKVTAAYRLQQASLLTGMAVEQTGLGLCRAMENSLGVVFGLSRGMAAGILLPAILNCNAHAAGQRYASLSRAAGLGGSREELGIRNLRSGLIRMRRELGLPGTLLQAGADLQTVWNSSRRITELTLEDPECRNNPVTVDDFMVRRILDAITGRI